jgi:hypothetical protein
VRVDEAILCIAGGIPQRAIIEVLDKNDRSILGNYYFFGPETAVRISSPLIHACYTESCQGAS